MFNIFRKKKNCSNTKHFSQAYKLIKIQGKLVEFLRCISFYRQVKIYVSLKLTPYIYITTTKIFSQFTKKKTNHRHYFIKVEAEKLGVKPCFLYFPIFSFLFLLFLYTLYKYFSFSFNLILARLYLN